MFLFLLVVFSTTNRIRGEILLSHDRYLQSHGITCGTKLDTTSQSSRARVLNGNEVSNQEYPWLAIIWRSIFGTNGGYNRVQCGGVIVSRHAILTAGQCLCNDDPNLLGTDLKFRTVKLRGTILTCGRNLNLNKKAKNQIEYSIGTQGTALRSEKHNANLEAYLYDYDPAETFFSKNGDIGIVIDKHGLPLNEHKANPICLPTDPSFIKSASERYEGVEVTLAGRGLRYVNSGQTNIFNNPITSCLTNERRQPHRNQLQGRAGWGSSFQQCRPLEYNASQTSSFCVDLHVVDDLISSEANVIFEVSNSMQTVTPRIELPKKGKCQKYWAKALEAYDKTDQKFRSTQTLRHDAHRIILRNSRNSNVDYKVCLNWKKLSVYGICKTGADDLDDWGFCSRSCQVSSRLPERFIDIEPHVAQFADYEEFKALYFENPRDVIRSDSSILSKTSLKAFLLAC